MQVHKIDGTNHNSHPYIAVFENLISYLIFWKETNQEFC